MSIGIYFKTLELKQVRCFGENAVLDLTDQKYTFRRWSIILGNNGVGKTTLLQLLVLSSTCEAGIHNDGRRMFAQKIFERPFTLSKNNENAETVDCSLTSTYLFYPGNVFESLKAERKFKGLKTYQLSFNTAFDNQFVLGYGANRFMSFNKLNAQRPDASETLFDEDAKLINAEEWLLGMDYAASRESDLKSFAEKRRQLIIDVLKEILPGVSDIRFTTPTKENLVPKVEFKTDFGWTNIHQLSLGYKTMVAWIVDVAARMFERYPDSGNPLSEPVVILVDEIDLHLHPKWQRKIFDFLTEKFPRAQFIVTAHSPLVVQSAPKDANIIVLRQAVDEDGNAYVKIDNDVESVRTWRLDQIMTSDLFGLDSARNPEIEQQMNERTALIQKDALTPAEQARLDELNNLADALPTAEDRTDREAMEIIRKAASFYKQKQAQDDKA